MATISDPTLPSPVAQSSQAKTDRRQNASPPPPSKRDRKRQQVVERIAILADKFAQNKDSLYRDQLQKIQIDTALVMRANPYLDRPLDPLKADFPEHMQAAASDKGRPPTQSLLEMAGPKFAEWQGDIEDLVEVRDVDMTRQKYEYDRKCQEHRNTHAYKIEVSKREHRALADTLRDRLINAITAKKFRLNKEKEALEVADASVLLLHPNQFCLANPASPGGNHGKRASRLRRDADDVTNYSDGSKKRKRNAHDDDGSPAPSRQRLDPNATTALWQNERMRNVVAGKTFVPTQTYSLEKLFTEKELTLTHNTAALAAHKHILTHKVGKDGHVLDSPSASTDAAAAAAPSAAAEPLTAPSMERHHSTRSTRGGQAHQNFIDDKLIGLEALTSFHLPANLDRVSSHEPKLPPWQGLQYAKGYPKTADINTPPALQPDDISADLASISILKQYEALHGRGSNFTVDNGGRAVLEACVTPLAESRYVSYHQGKRTSADDLRIALDLPTSSLRDDPTSTPQSHTPLQVPAPTSVPMSRTSSLGGVGMSRQGSGRGKRRA